MTLAVREHGHGPAVVWLHGYTMDCSLWTPLWDALPGWRHVGVDLPGHGRSPELAPGTALADVAHQVAEVAEAYGAVRLVALSFGTTVALQVALDHPAVAERLVLAAPTIGGSPAEPGTARRYQELSALRRVGAGGERLADYWMRSPPDIFRGTETRPELRAAVRAVIARHAWTELGTGAMAAIVNRVHTDDALATIGADTCLLVGEHDLPGTRGNVTRLAATVPRVRTRELAGCGHLCLLERPALAAPEIDEHLAR